MNAQTTNESGLRAALSVCKTHYALLRPMLHSYLAEVEIVGRDACELCKLDRTHLAGRGYVAETRTKSGSWR